MAPDGKRTPTQIRSAPRALAIAFASGFNETKTLGGYRAVMRRVEPLTTVK